MTSHSSAKVRLDQLLAHETPEHRARILDLVVKLDIDPDEEFFALCIGLGHLSALLFEAPDQWRQTFADFEDELAAWAASNTATLNRLTRQVEATETLSQTSSELATVLSSLTQTCNVLLREQQAAIAVLESTWGQLQKDNTDVLQLLQALTRQQEEQMKREQAILAALKALQGPDPLGFASPLQSNRFRQLVLLATVAYTVTLSVGFATASVLYLGDRNVLHRTAQKVEYLLQKQNRRECQEGLIPAESPLCNG